MKSGEVELGRWGRVRECVDFFGLGTRPALFRQSDFSTIPSCLFLIRWLWNSLMTRWWDRVRLCRTGVVGWMGTSGVGARLALSRRPRLSTTPVRQFSD